MMIGALPTLALDTVDLAVVVPAKDEAGSVLSLVEEIRCALEGSIVFELIYVDDGSTDATLARLAEAKRCCSHLRVIRHKASCGQSQAIITGIKAARAAWIVTLDGDGQNDPADIPVLFARLQAMRYETAIQSMLIGYRAVRHDTWGKRITSRLANRLRAVLLKDDTPDTGCGLKMFPRAAFLGFPHFDHMHRYLPALMIRSGGQVISCAVNHRPRSSGRSHYGTLDRLWVSLFDLVGMLWLQRRCHRPDVISLEEN